MDVILFQRSLPSPSKSYSKAKLILHLKSFGMIKKLALVPLMEQFIRDTKTGRRRKVNGERISMATVKCYRYILKQLVEYESFLRHKFVLAVMTVL